MKPHVISCSGTADFLAALPEFLGFTASDSIFLIFFSGKRAQSAARFDLPPTGSTAEHTAQLLNGIEHVVRKARQHSPGFSEPALVITTAERFAGLGDAPRRSLAERIEHRLLRDGVKLRESCVRAADGWGSYADRELPERGRSLDDIRNSRAVRHAPKRETPVPDLATWGDIPRPDRRRARTIADYLRDFRDVYFPGALENPPCSDAPGEPSMDRWAPFREIEQLARALHCADRRLSPRLTARLIRATLHRDTWFMLTLALLTRPEFPAELAKDFSTNIFHQVPLTTTEAHAVSCPQTPPNWNIRETIGSVQPTWEGRTQLVLVRAHLLTAISECPTALRGRILALSGWVWWVTGIQTVAVHHAALALKQAPDDDLIREVHQLLTMPVPGTPAAVGSTRLGGGEVYSSSEITQLIESGLAELGSVGSVSDERTGG